MSLALHVGLIATMVVATTQHDALTGSTIETRSAPPRTNTAPTNAPTVPAVDVPPVTVPTEIPTGIPTEFAAPIDLPVGDGGLGAPSDAGGGTPIGSGDAALGADAVDVPAALRSGSPLPRYPDILRQSRIEGGVRVRFIVNEDGRADLASLVILESTHPAFVESVRAVLPRLRFTPARVGRERVRQVVEIPFGFQLRFRP